MLLDSYNLDKMRLAPLLPEQQELLSVMVEASRSVPRSQRQPVLLLESFGSPGATMLHPGLHAIGREGYTAYISDARELAERGLVRLDVISQSSYSADVTATGFHYYESLKTTEPSTGVETEIRGYIESEQFATRHPGALSKWRQAHEALWSSDSASQLTTIGHLCREALQAFATEAVNSTEANDADSNPQHTANRIKAAISTRITSDRVRQLGDALISYWQAVNGITQRQEHGATKSEELVWEDARRVVFQTLLVMFELDRALG